MPQPSELTNKKIKLRASLTGSSPTHEACMLYLSPPVGALPAIKFHSEQAKSCREIILLSNGANS